MVEPARNIIWIASYPKSGNTWVRFMACNLLFGRQESANSVSALAPDIHETAPALLAGSHSGLVKTHFACAPGLPMLERTAGAIYIIRNPADVLVSNYFYSLRRTVGTSTNQPDFDRYFEQFVSKRGDPRWISLGMGSWEDNVRSWLRTRHPFPVAGIRYEDMSADPVKVCRMLAQLLRPTSSEEEIRQAVADSSFTRMREIEERDIRDRRVGIFYKPYLKSAIEAGSRFMRAGAVGDGARKLTPTQQAQLTRTFEPVLAELGYAAAASAAIPS
jgi:hypothetical protein